MLLRNIKLVNQGISSFSWIMALKLASFAKCSYVVGSLCALFGFSNIVSPLVGSFSGLLGSVIVFGSLMLIKYVYAGSLGLPILAFYLPGFCASLYFAKPGLITRFILPLSCMALFIANPIGFAAAPYSFFWLIPAIFYVMDKNSLFYHALGSTLVAHAVGSTIWLYTVPMTSGAWLALIPLVACERLCFALGITGLHSIISWVGKTVQNTIGAPEYQKLS